MSEQIEGRNAVLEAFRSGKCVGQAFCSGQMPGWTSTHHYP